MLMVFTIRAQPEIRDFPKGLGNVNLDELFDSCLRGITNVVNLRSCTWTRDGSLASSILFEILKHRSLRELEINGRHYGNYDPMILPQFTSVRRIKLIMPSPSVVEVLPRWLRSLVNPLQSLSIVCKARPSLGGFTHSQLLRRSQNRVLLPSRMRS